jgi:hypothetical protein
LTSDAKSCHLFFSFTFLLLLMGGVCVCVLAGDVITAKLPMIIRADTVQDKRPQFQSLKVHTSLVFGLAA